MGTESDDGSVRGRRADHLPNTTPAVAATTTKMINAIPKTPSRENTTRALRFPGVTAVEPAPV